MPDCKTCKESRHNVESVPYIAHEASEARQERTIKRLWIALIICIVGLIGMFIYEAQFTKESVWQEVDTGEGDAYVAGIRDVNYGEDQTESNAPNP